MSDDVTAVVLVGGRSRRMGRDKALIVGDASGRTLTQLVLDALSGVASTALLSGRALPCLGQIATPCGGDPAHGPLAVPEADHEGAGRHRTVVGEDRGGGPPGDANRA